jgi:hypothetical protein
MRVLVVVLGSVLLASCAGIKYPEIAVYGQNNSMLDRCNVVGQATGEVYMGLNAVNNRSNNTMEARNAMRTQVKKMGGDALIPGDITRSDMVGNYVYTMTVLNCGQQQQDLINTNYKNSTEQRLKKLDALFSRGVISEAEYKKARLQILSDV